MKKVLLATSAIVAAGMVSLVAGAQAQNTPPGSFNVGQGAVKLGVGGFMEQVFGYASNKDSVVGKKVGFDQWSDTEILFKAWGRLPNGLELMATIELEGNESGTDQIDESYMDIRGSFGQITLGSTNDAAYKATNSNTPGSISVGEAIPDGADNYFARPSGVASSIFDYRASGADIDNDAEKIIYFSPRFAGFQVGVSYTPENSQDTDAIASQLGQYHSGISIGVSYTMPFQGGSFGASAGYLTFDHPNNAATPDPDVWIIASKVVFGQFSVAGSYRDADGLRASNGTSTTTSIDGTKWAVGGAWNPGPYRVSLVYHRGEEEGLLANPADDEYSIWQAQIATDLARGVKIFGSIYRAEIEDEDEAGAENEGWAASVGVRLTF